MATSRAKSTAQALVVDVDGVIDEGLEPRGRSNVAEFTVSDLSNAIKRTLEGTYGHVRLRGEISGFRGVHASGHCYFGLKDEKSKIEAVIWRGVYGSLRFKPQEGLEVIATGKVSSFPGSSKYQIVIEQLEPAGVGALMALLEERKKKLGAEGLFAPERKRPLPFLPRVVGIITSPTGAVIRDMLHGFNERFPTRVIVWPVRVQGETSAQEVAAAVRGFNAFAVSGGRVPRPDVLIVARGGGSLEDLWGFNDEIVARAVAESAIPVISAVGHETDWTLIDLVADARAPTPTKAAEWAVPKYSELLDQTDKLSGRLVIGMRRRLEQARAEWRAAARGLPKLQDLVALPRQRFDAASLRLSRALSANTQAHGKRLARVAPRLQVRLLGQRVQRAQDSLDRTAQRAAGALSRVAQGRRTRLERVLGRLTPQVLINRVARARAELDAEAKLMLSLSYQSVLKRGFALVRDDDGRAIRSTTAALPGANLTVELADGRINVHVDDGLDAGGSGRSTLRGSGRKVAGNQGKLF